jgi:hypothetical protein
MEKFYKILLAAGALICLFLFWIDIYLGAMGVIILVALAISILIMEDSRILPEISVRLGDDAKKIVVENTGNAPANRIHVTLIPLDIEFDIPELSADTRYEYPLTHMIGEVKAEVIFDDANGGHASRTFSLSALGKSDDDLLRPMFPLFKWK